MSMNLLARFASQMRHLLLVAAVLQLVLVSVEKATGQEWSQLAPTGGPPAARAAASSVFDDATNQMIIFGGGNCADFADTWSLAVSESPKWTELFPSGGPPAARTGHTAVYDSANSRMTVFGGGLGCSAPCSNDTWVLSNANSVGGSPAWTELSPTGSKPVVRIFHTAVYDPNSNRMIVFGGNNCYTAGAAYYNDVWVLTNANGLGGTPAWTQLTPAGAAPPARENHGASYDPASNRMTIFGGSNSGGYLNDVWVLSDANGVGGTPTWTQLAPTGMLPSPRAGFATVNDSESNRMIVFDGGNASGLSNETWVLSGANGLASPAWTLLSPSATPPSPKQEATAVFDESLNEFVVFAGIQNGTGATADTWALTLTTNTTTPRVPVFEGVGATWIQVYSPFLGDANEDSYTTYEYATSINGPWTGCGNGVPGDVDWRRCAVNELTPNTPYYFRVTFYDPDGVIGAAAQVIGPITTLAVSNDFATIGQAAANVQDTNILVSIPVSDDANTNSNGTVSIATNLNGPWIQRCGSMANIGPKQCRVHGLTNGTDYYLQVNITDPDGVVGNAPQVIGPIHYTGLTDLALGKPVTADPGWGCCSDPNQLTNGVVEPSSWANGFAWTGGTGDWGGGTPGIKEATVDLQTAQTIGRVDWWIQNAQSVPATWSVSVSNDGTSFSQVFENSEVTCRTETEDLNIGWSSPSCKLKALFPELMARYVRISFDDSTLFGGMHGWAVQVEAFGAAGTTSPPLVSLSATSLSFAPTAVGTSSGSQSVTLTNNGNAALPITSIALTGADASSFVFANTCATSLAAGASCTIHGHFAPIASGALTAAVTVTDNGGNSQQNIALSGTGVEPSVTLSATSLAYGSVNVGSTSSSQTVTMTNTGNAALAITSIAVTGTNASSFGFANSCGNSLAVGASCTIHGHFAPTAAGAATATVTITDSASTSPQTIALTGTGVTPMVTLSATSLAYPTTMVGSSSASQSVTMTNTGTATLTISSIAVTGTNASSFVFGNTCARSLAVGASCSIHGHFAPTTTGALTAVVTISDSATSSPQSINLSGTGQ